MKPSTSYNICANTAGRKQNDMAIGSLWQCFSPAQDAFSPQIQLPQAVLEAVVSSRTVQRQLRPETLTSCNICNAMM